MPFGSEQKDVRPIHEGLLIRGLLHRHIAGGHKPIAAMAALVIEAVPYSESIQADTEQMVTEEIDLLIKALETLKRRVLNRWEDPYR